MGRPVEYTNEDLLGYARKFLEVTGKFPSRDDFKGERKNYYEKLLQTSLPHARTFERAFGTWQAVRDMFGAGTSKFTPSEMAEKLSMEYAVSMLGMVPVDNETGVVDGHIGQQRVEVKGSVLSRASSENQNYRFRWSLHYREISKLVDRLVLVGLLKNGQIAVVIDIAGAEALEAFADKKKTLDFSISSLYGQRESKYWPYITQMNPVLNADNIEDYL